MSVTFKVKGLAEVMKHVDPAILEQPVKEFYERCGEYALNAAKAKSPVDTGRLRSSLARTGGGIFQRVSSWAQSTFGGGGNIWRYDGGRVPRSLTVGTNVTHDGESYPQKLDESPFTRYRGTQFAGQKTQGWFSQARDALNDKVKDYLSIMARDIETLWSRR
jgi:hypothetical protein